MDLGIAGRRAIVCASSKGLGRACAEALAAAGVELVVNGRDAGVLEETAGHIRRAHGVRVEAVAADITTPEGRAAVLAACPDPDILVNNAGGPPAGDFREWEKSDWLAALEAQMLTPIALIKATIDAMGARGFGRIVNITSAVVKAPAAAMGLSAGARAGLTGFVAGLARQSARRGITINNLLPGSFATDRSEVFVAAAMREEGLDRAAAIARLEGAIPAGRFGRPAEFGATCAFLASTHAGYITGQNLVIDGGDYPGLF